MKHELEALIRAGNFAEARKRIRQIKVKTIARSEALTYANLAGRLGYNQLSVRMLSPIIQRDKPGTAAASNEEKVQYANGMRKLGAVSAALKILDPIDLDQCPKAALELTFCYFAQWKYDQ